MYRRVLKLLLARANFTLSVYCLLPRPCGLISDAVTFANHQTTSSYITILHLLASVDITCTERLFTVNCNDLDQIGLWRAK
jgi:hypothetical protein